MRGCKTTSLAKNKNKKTIGNQLERPASLRQPSTVCLLCFLSCIPFFTSISTPVSCVQTKRQRHSCACLCHMGLFFGGTPSFGGIKRDTKGETKGIPRWVFRFGRWTTWTSQHARAPKAQLPRRHLHHRIPAHRDPPQRLPLERPAQRHRLGGGRRFPPKKGEGEWPGIQKCGAFGSDKAQSAG